MGRRSDSRQKMLETTADLLQRQGYAATGLNQIIRESGTPKGSLYFHFPGGKEELAAEAIRNSGGEMRGALHQILEVTQDPATAIEMVTAHLAQRMKESGWELGCPMATVALECGSSVPALRQIVEDTYKGWETVIVERMTAAGLAEDAARQIAVFTLSAIEGAMLLSRVYQSTEPLEHTGAVLAEMARNALGV